MVKKTNYKTKVTEIENKIFIAIGLETPAALSTKVTGNENNTPDITGFITIPEFKRLTKISFEVTKRLAGNIQVDTALSIAGKSKEK